MTLSGGLGEPTRQASGRRAEDFALAYLRAQGLVLVERNYRCKLGEIDLIMKEGAKLVFVEVRYRADDSFGGALLSIGPRKQARIIRAAGYYLVSKRIDRPARFDVAVVSPDGGGLAIQWIKDAFQAGQGGGWRL